MVEVVIEFLEDRLDAEVLRFLQAYRSCLAPGIEAHEVELVVVEGLQRGKLIFGDLEVELLQRMLDEGMDEVFEGPEIVEWTIEC